ncbi:MAG: hypothetical protein M3548_17935 [Actinomycetota bacterium]|nr:hypothetical protein [Actinomycetota bacterium]
MVSPEIAGSPAVDAAAIAELLRSMPRYDAPAATRAVWLDRKAVVLDSIAARSATACPYCEWPGGHAPGCPRAAHTTSGVL